MGSGNFSDEFRRDAVAQITERGYPLRRFRSGSGSVSTRSMRVAGSSRSLLDRAMRIKQQRSCD